MISLSWSLSDSPHDPARELHQTEDVSGSALRPAQLMLFASSVLDLALLRHLIRAELAEAGDAGLRWMVNPVNIGKATVGY